MRDSFSEFHPVTNFAYFTAVTAFGMFYTDPVFQGFSLTAALVYSTGLKGRKGLKNNIYFMFSAIIFMAVLNPAFNHEGTTILFYLKGGNPVTLEAIAYGISSSLTFITVILWFSCYNSVMTSDKFIYLFGKIIPALSMIFSMVLRFVPRYADQIKAVSKAQKCIGKDVSQGNLIHKAQNGINIISVISTWALENAIETADSMKARGYGLPGRTSFSIFRFQKRDKILLPAIILPSLIVSAGDLAGHGRMIFFPSIRFPEITIIKVIIYIAYLVLHMIPIIVNVWEAVKWKHIKSRISILHIRI